MSLEPEISIYKNFSEEIDNAGLGIYVDGDCAASNQQPKGLSGLGEVMQASYQGVGISQLLFSTIRQGKGNIKIVKMQALEDDPRAKEMEELSQMISYNVITPEEVNLLYLCAVNLLKQGLKVWEKSWGNPFHSKELKNVTLNLIRIKAFSVIDGLGIDGPKSEESPYSTERILEFLTYCSKFVEKIIDAAFVDAEIQDFRENEVRANALRNCSSSIH